MPARRSLHVRHERAHCQTSWMKHKVVCAMTRAHCSYRCHAGLERTNAVTPRFLVRSPNDWKRSTITRTTTCNTTYVSGARMCRAVPTCRMLTHAYLLVVCNLRLLLLQTLLDLGNPVPSIEVQHTKPHPHTHARHQRWPSPEQPRSSTAASSCALCTHRKCCVLSCLRPFGAFITSVLLGLSHAGSQPPASEHASTTAGAVSPALAVVQSVAAARCTAHDRP